MSDGPKAHVRLVTGPATICIACSVGRHHACATKGDCLCCGESWKTWNDAQTQSVIVATAANAAIGAIEPAPTVPVVLLALMRMLVGLVISHSGDLEKVILDLRGMHRESTKVGPPSVREV